MPPLPVAPIQSATRDCPFCAEPIAIAAVKCRHCNEFLDPSLRAQAAVAVKAVASPSNVTQTVVVQGSKYQFPHVLHLTLTLFTCGLWLPIWIIHALIRLNKQN